MPFAQGLVRADHPGHQGRRGDTPLPRFPDEVVTQGLDGLPDRLAEYAALGARFAKWRAVIRIGAGRPTAACVDANAERSRGSPPLPRRPAWSRSSSPRC